MSGHSKWSSIKHKKGALDAKRGQLFTKLARDITMAARHGGDPAMNASLRLTILKAREANMPGDNIDRAIQRGAGGGDSDALMEITYEGYGPGGTAVIVDTVTDNRNRTVADLRQAFSRGGGNLAENGAVGWLFDMRGVISIEVKKGVDTDEAQLAAIDAGALDVTFDEDEIEVLTEPAQMEPVREALTAAGFTIASADVARVPKNTVTLDEKAAIQAIKLLERLDDLDDVSRVTSNADFPASVLESAELAG